MEQSIATFDNKSKILKEELEQQISKKDTVKVAAPYFSVYGYQELQDQLDYVDEFKFIYTEPTFSESQVEKEKKEFYIPRLQRERSVYGTDMEVKLRNELKQRLIARECGEWIESKAQFKSLKSPQSVMNCLMVDHEDEKAIYFPFDGMTSAGLGTQAGKNSYTLITRAGNDVANPLDAAFEELWNNDRLAEDVTQKVLDSLVTLYKENAPEEIYYSVLSDIFAEFLDDLDEDVLPKETTGFKNSKIWSMLYDFQRDAALAIINKLEKYNGCILADSVGLGKTFTALAVIKYFETRNRSVLVLCPKKLSDNWVTYKSNVKNNPIASDRLRYDVLYHTDLSRDKGKTVQGLDINAINWDNYDLVVIDESHNFRNGSQSSSKSEDKENRYTKLLNKVITSGVKTRVLMLSATPVNNKFLDLQNQLQLAYADSEVPWHELLGLKNDIKTTFRLAQGRYNEWSKMPASERTTNALMDLMSPDFFKLLDQVTVARSRKQIQEYYDVDAIGPFPERLNPKNLRPGLSTKEDAVTYKEIVDALSRLSLASYIPSAYIHPSRLSRYDVGGLSIAGRESGIRKFMAVGLLKRLESSVHSFKITLGRVQESVHGRLELLEYYQQVKAVDPVAAAKMTITYDKDADQFLDDDDQETLDVMSSKQDIRIEDLDWVSWKRHMEEDEKTLLELVHQIEGVDPEHDAKLLELQQDIAQKISHPINDDNKKILIFTAFADTADYLFEHISLYAKNEFGIEVAEVTGKKPGISTIKEIHNNTQDVLCCFSPKSKDRDILLPQFANKNIDILIATDCISEGQNLQDCDYVINYDIHWNPVRIVQRYGRVDRIGSSNDVIQLVNFWPNIELDEYLNLKDRVEDRMKSMVLTSTGDDNPIDPNDDADAQYRKNQIQKMQNGNIDLEDVTNGVSITNLGLDEFRTDLLSWRKLHPNAKKPPHGIYAVVEGDEPGIVFVLKNRKEELNLSKQNRFHPFYMVYVSNNREVILNQMQSRDVLSFIRNNCHGKNKPNRELCLKYNKITKNGKDMKHASELLDIAVDSIIDADQRSIADSFFDSGIMSIDSVRSKSLDDFELLDFLVVM